MRDLTLDPSLIALYLAVDYWDYLGWQYTMALDVHANREPAYAAARGDRDVYTPQTVVNGAVAVLGSDSDAIEKAIKETRKNPQALSLPVKLRIEADKVIADLPSATGNVRSAEVWL